MNETEQIFVERINWAHQRQLTMVAISLGLGIGIIEILSFSQQVFEIMHWLIAVCFVFSFYSIFRFEQEIFRWQYKLKAEWKIRFEDSTFHYFFDYKDPDMPINERLYGIVAVIFILFVVIFVGRYFTSSEIDSSNISSITTMVGFALGLISASLVYIILDKYRRKNTEGTTVKLVSTAYDSVGRYWLYLKFSNRLRTVRIQVFQGFVFPKTKKWSITLAKIADDYVQVDAVSNKGY